LAALVSGISMRRVWWRLAIQLPSLGFRYVINVRKCASRNGATQGGNAALDDPINVDQ